MKRMAPVAVVACMVAAGAWARDDSARDDYDLLQSIPSPFEMIAPSFPPYYRTAVDLSGPVAEEMKRSLVKMGFSAPVYEETMDRGRDFNLAIANKDYPLETRALISGVLNPTEMTESLLSSLLKYRDPDFLLALRKETVTTRRATRHNGQPAILVTLRPKGSERFSYSYEDLGSYVREAWISELSVALDSVSHRVLELTSNRHSRQVAANAAESPTGKETRHRYVFEYDTLRGEYLPSRLTLTTDDSLVVVLSARYRREGDRTVFDGRTICYRRPRTPESCLVMKYGRYAIEKPSDRQESFSGTRTKYAQRLEKAAGLSRKATAALKKGDLSEAGRVLRRLVDEYPETPQAVEAGKLLSNLPQ